MDFTRFNGYYPPTYRKSQPVCYCPPNSYAKAWNSSSRYLYTQQKLSDELRKKLEEHIQDKKEIVKYLELLDSVENLPPEIQVMILKKLLQEEVEPRLLQCPISTPLKIGPEQSVSAVSYSNNGDYLIVGSENRGEWGGNFYVLPSQNPSQVYKSKGFGKGISSISPSVDNTKFAIGSENGQTMVWNVNGTQIAETFTSLLGRVGGVESVSFSPNGIDVSSGYQYGTVSVWDTSQPGDQPPIATPSHGFYHPAYVSYSPDGMRIAAGIGTEINVWDAAQIVQPAQPAQPVKVFQQPEESYKVTALSYSPDGTRIASGADNGSVYIWGDAGLLRIYTTEGSSVNSIAYNKRGDRLAAGLNNNKILVWDVTKETDKPLFTFATGSKVNSVSFDPLSGSLASGDNDGNVQIWDTSLVVIQQLYRSAIVGTDAMLLLVILASLHAKRPDKTILLTPIERRIFDTLPEELRRVVESCFKINRFAS